MMAENRGEKGEDIMTDNNNECSSAIEDFLNAPPFDPESIVSEPPLKDGEDPLLILSVVSALSELAPQGDEFLK
jgi:hypothetical protein